MGEKVNKSILYSKEDSISIEDCIIHNALCMNHSDVMYYAFQLAAEDNGIDFKEVPKFKFNNTNIQVDPEEYASTKSFSVEAEDWSTVVEKFKKQLNVEKVRISYLTRLVLSNYRMKLTKGTKEKKVTVVQSRTIDGVELLRKVNDYAAAQILAGKIDRVLEFIGEADDRP